MNLTYNCVAKCKHKYQNYPKNTLYIYIYIYIFGNDDIYRHGIISVFIFYKKCSLFHNFIFFLFK